MGEALTAYIVRILAAVLTPSTDSKGNYAMLWLDSRKATGLPADMSFGAGLLTAVLRVDARPETPLHETATLLHEGIKQQVQVAKRKAAVANYAADKGMVFEMVQ